MPSDSPSTQQAILERLQAAEQLLAGFDLSALDPDHLPPITHAVRRVQNRCTAATIAIAKQARATGDDPDATLLGQGDVSGSAARKESERSETAEAMAEVDDEVTAGNISGEHLDAISRARRNLDEAERALFDQLAPELAEAAAAMPVDTFKRKLRAIVDRCRQDHGLTQLEKQRKASGLKMWTSNDGMGHTHITADPERHELLRTAIERHAASMAAAAKKHGESVAHGPALMLDALIDLLGRSQGDLGRPTITIIVDDDTVRHGPHDGTVCETDAGVDLPISVVQRHLCDSVTQTVRFGADGLPLDVGRRYRTATAAQWVALKAMYRTCAWNGCDRPITWCQAHHITEWEAGGPTNLDNLIPLCSKHHHAVHEGGWSIRLLPDRTLEIRRPASAARSSCPSSNGQSSDGQSSNGRLLNGPPMSGEPPGGAPPTRDRSRDRHQRRSRPGSAAPNTNTPAWASTRPDRRPTVADATVNNATVADATVKHHS